jgi:RNA polymerase sigma-70 factor (ECF subfamily)
MTADEVAAAYRQFGTAVLARCRRMLGSASFAEDALQEVFLRLYRYGDAFRAADSKLLWLYRVADRCCLDHIAKSDLRRRVVLVDDPDQLGASGQESSPEALGSAEDRQLVHALLGRFSPRVRRVAYLYYVDEMTMDEIARETGWSRKTISRKLAAVRSRAGVLRQRLCGENA